MGSSRRELPPCPWSFLSEFHVVRVFCTSLPPVGPVQGQQPAAPGVCLVACFMEEVIGAGAGLKRCTPPWEGQSQELGDVGRTPQIVCPLLLCFMSHFPFEPQLSRLYNGSPNSRMPELSASARILIAVGSWKGRVNSKSPPLTFGLAHFHGQGGHTWGMWPPTPIPSHPYRCHSVAPIWVDGSVGSASPPFGNLWCLAQVLPNPISYSSLSLSLFPTPPHPLLLLCPQRLEWVGG